MTSDLETRALSRPWFYPFRLPSGATTPSYDGGWLDGIHHTRSAMLDAVARASDLKLFNLEDIGPHYATTLRLWRVRFFANLAQVRQLGYPERFVRLWEYYLCYCEGGFASLGRDCDLWYRCCLHGLPGFGIRGGRRWRIRGGRRWRSRRGWCGCRCRWHGQGGRVGGWRHSQGAGHLRRRRCHIAGDARIAGCAAQAPRARAANVNIGNNRGRFMRTSL